MFKRILLSGIIALIGTTYAIGQVFTIDNNGIVKCEGATVGDTATIFGDTYEAVDRALFFQRRDEGADLSKVCTSLVTDMSRMFYGADAFNADISAWDVSTVTDMNNMFLGADIFNADISAWDVSSVTDMGYMFYSADAFNADISAWDVSKVTNMRFMFFNAQTFNADISNWDVSNVTNMAFMFVGVNSFNADISSWDVSAVTDMRGMFEDASVFNVDISSWDVSTVTAMRGMFRSADVFNADISAWDVSTVTDMGYMFYNANAFNADISAWDVSKVTDMGSMFFSADAFNADISAWDVSTVTNMSRMFYVAEAFNADIGSWDVSTVTDMSEMFFSADAFNADISSWDVSTVTNMRAMFYNATAFNADISAWCVSNISSEPSNFATSSPLTNANKPIWGTCPGLPDQGVLGNPSDSAEDVSITPSMEWKSDDLATKYQLQIFEGFNPVVIDTMVIDTMVIDTTFSVSNSLKGGTQYNWRVRGINESKSLTGDWSEAWSFTTIVVAPTLVYPANEASSVATTPTIKWSVAKLATNYQLQLSTASDFSVITLDSTLSDTSLAVDQALVYEASYYWRVKASNEAGGSGWSEIWSFTTIIEAPSLVTLSNPANEAGSVETTPTIKWNTSVRASEYQLQLSSVSDFSGITLDSTVTDTSVTLTQALANETSYYWRVKASNAGGESAWSEVWNFTTIVTNPMMVKLTYPANDTTGIDLQPSLSWQALTGADSYSVQLATDDAFNNVVIDSSQVTATSLAIESSLEYSTQYYWRVRAENAGGSGDWSEVWSFTTTVESPIAAQLLSPANEADVTTLLPEFSWNQSEGADEYNVQLAISSEFSSTLLDSTLSDTSLVPVQKLNSGSDYFWRVRASNVGGESEWSEVFSFNIGINVSNELEDLPDEFSLSQNYPNPFNPSTQISYSLPEASLVKLDIINMLGQRVATLVNERKTAGNYTVQFNASNLSSGVYFYMIQAGEFTKTNKMLLIK